MMSTPPELSRMRREYLSGELLEKDLAETWPVQFARWMADALAARIPEPNAMVLATAGPDAQPSARTVLLKDFDERGFTFFTNYGSRKGREAVANPAASLVFPWIPLHRQVVVCGGLEKVDRAETVAYFAKRPRDSQLGAWASTQSRPVDGRGALEQEFERVAEIYPDEVPAPPHWGGFRVLPETVEFWQGRPNRLHDRLRFHRTNTGWTIERLAP